jgi:ADP-ribose pyrophosphatase YjhB (NUDIX family)
MKTETNTYNYSVGTGAIIFSPAKDSILLIEERKAPGRWGIVGGKLERMPSLANVEKEILEETGYRVSFEGLVAVYQRYDQDPQRISFIYRAVVVSRDAEPDAAEVITSRWFKLEELPWDQLRFEDNRRMIEDALQNVSPLPLSGIVSLP